MASFILEKQLGKNFDLLAIGYARHKETKKRFDKLRKILGAKNFCVDVSGMLVAKLIKSKKEKILQSIKEIKGRKRLVGCNYTWEGNEDVFNCKYAI